MQTRFGITAFSEVVQIAEDENDGEQSKYVEGNDELVGEMVGEGLKGQLINLCFFYIYFGAN